MPDGEQRDTGHRRTDGEDQQRIAGGHGQQQRKAEEEQTSYLPGVKMVLRGAQDGFPPFCLSTAWHMHTLDARPPPIAVW